MKIGPKFKIGKRLGPSVFEKCQTQKFVLSQSKGERSNKRRGGARSDYARQFLEKQKVRYTYGISEKQFKNYIREASKGSSHTPSESLFRLLEGRLDNVVYRMGLAPTRRAARQMVSHGHICINGHKSTIPSERTRAADIITIREGSRSSKLFQNLDERLKDYTAPNWLSFELAKNTGSIKNLPTYKRDENAFDLIPVLEFYSR